MPIKKILALALKFVSNEPPFDGSKAILSYLEETKSGAQRSGSLDKPLILFSGVRDHVYGSLFAILAQDLQAKHNVTAGFICTDSLNLTIGYRPINHVLRIRWIGMFFSRLWKQLYGGMELGCLYDACDPRHRYQSWMLKDRDELWRAFQQVKEHHSAVEYRGVEIWDLVVDTYLRFKPSASFDSGDPFVGALILQTVLDVHHLQAIFETSNISAFVTSNATYIQHGVAVRLAQKYGIPVVSFGNENKFGKLHKKDDVFHVLPSQNYKSNFQKMPQQRQRRALEQAHSALRAKFEAGTVTHMRYMRSSAFETSTKQKREVAEANGFKMPSPDDVVVFLHDFYDSPHAYDNFFFSDFWEWTTFVFSHLQKNGISFCVKPHPNQIKESGLVIDKLTQLYPDLSIIDPKTSNSVIFASQISCGITAYGSVAHELAYFGIPSISCAMNPHFSFDFTSCAATAEEYSELIARAAELKINQEQARHEVAMFYFMHYLNIGEDERTALNFFLDMKYMSASDIKKSPDKFIETLRSLRQHPGYEVLVASLMSLEPRHSIEGYVFNQR